ncbi:MAG: hypothetical protein CFE31_00205 [Rhizobiales bacterium PAR1]|nr:MAG: hypothetical protein CFE31_00205 [Rhizobiales bacterium PAR1]
MSHALATAIRPTSLFATSSSRARRRLAALLMATALAPVTLSLIPDSHGRFGIVRAFAKENITIDKIDLPNVAGGVTLTGLSITGSTLARAELEALLKSTGIAGLADKLEKFDADRIAIASVEWRMKSPKQEMTTVYEGFEATNIKAGAIERLVMKGGRQSGKMKAGEKMQNTETLIGKLSMETIDLAGLFRWMGTSDPTGKAPMKVLHGRYDLESMDIKMEDATVHIGRMTAAGFKARLAKQAPSDIIDIAVESSIKSEDSDNGMKMLSYFLNVYPSFEFGGGEVEGARVVAKDKATGVTFNGGMGKITFAGGAAPLFSVSDIVFKASDPAGKEDGGFSIKKVAQQGDIYALMMLGMKEVFTAAPDAKGAKKSAEAQRAEAALRQSVTEAAKGLTIKDFGFKLEGIDADFPPAKDTAAKSGNAKAGGKEAPAGDRVKLKLASFDATIASFVNLSPTRVDFVLSNLAVPLPSKSTDPGVASLKAFGIDTVDLSARIKATWDEGKSRFMIDDIMADMGKFGKVSLKGELGGIQRPLFENPVQNWPVTLMGGNVQSVTIDLENKGGFEKVLAQAAADQKKTPEQFKLEMSGMAPMILGSVMGGHADAAALSDAVAKFIRTPGKLHVKASANVPTGVTMMDFAAAQSNPTVLLQKLKFEASAK